MFPRQHLQGCAWNKLILLLLCNDGLPDRVIHGEKKSRVASPDAALLPVDSWLPSTGAVHWFSRKPDATALPPMRGNTGGRSRDAGYLLLCDDANNTSHFMRAFGILTVGCLQRMM